MKGYKEIKFEREGSFSLAGFVKEEDYELLKDFLDDYDGYVEDVKFFENADEEDIKERLGLTDEDFETTGKSFSSVEEMMADIDREMEKDDAKTAFIESVFSTLVQNYELYLEIFNDYASKILSEHEKEKTETEENSKKQSKCQNKSKNEETITFKEYLERALAGDIEDGKEIVIELEFNDDANCSCGDNCKCDSDEDLEESEQNYTFNDFDRDELEETIKNALKTGAEKGKKASKELSKATNRLIRASQPAINAFIDTISEKLEDYSEDK